MIPVAQPSISALEKKYVNEALESGWVSSTGEFVNSFEKGLAAYLKTSFVHTTSNGTAALHIALLALDIKPGDEVIIPASSFIATLNAVLYVGATPVFVDNELETWGMDATAVAAKITSKTKAIIAVHLYGFACDIRKLKALSDEYHVYLVEDNAESFGAEAEDKKLGTIGDIGCYSFFGNKIITTGEGGAVSTANEELAQKMFLYKNQGRRTAKTYFHEVMGFNFRMTNVQAAFGLAQLEQINYFLTERARVELRYDQQLQNIIERPHDLNYTKHVNWLYSGLLKKSIIIEKLCGYLLEQGIDTRRVFLPMNQMPYLNKDLQMESFSCAERLSDNGITLPTYVDLTNEQIDFICRHIKEYVAKNA